MNLKTRRTATAQSLAELHKHLGDAYLALHRAADANDKGKPALSRQSSIRLTKMARDIQVALGSLEAPFWSLAGADTPWGGTAFANSDDPEAWLELLAELGERNSKESEPADDEFPF